MAEERHNYGIEVRGGSKKASNVPSHKESTVYVRSLSSAGSTSPQASKPRSWLGVVSIGDLVSKDLDRSGCSAGVGDGRLPMRSLRCLPTLFSADLHKALQPENGFTGPCALLPIHSVLYAISLSRSTSMEVRAGSQIRLPVRDEGEAASTLAQGFHDVGEPSAQASTHCISLRRFSAPRGSCLLCSGRLARTE